uniref:26S proteasome non-ATPase regulatory subunit 1 n=1 Tax=Rhabditophanes sp. KR3021 TaxID=114890 RepID=A0AC35TPB7_9BILA
MTLYLLNQWKAQNYQLQDASSFMIALDSEHYSWADKELIIEAFDDWDVLTPTWFEVANYLETIERLCENVNFKQRHRAALLSSKVAYCLGDYASALALALAAEEKFSLTPRLSSPQNGPQDEQFINKIIETAIDTYKNSRKNSLLVDEKLEKLINRVFETNLKKKDYSFVIGLALETKRLDIIEVTIKRSDDKQVVLADTVRKVIEVEIDSTFKGQVLDLLFKMFSDMAEPDFSSMCQCLIKLEQPSAVAEILSRLCKNEEGILLGYQIAFDLYENASQQFINKIVKAMDSQTSCTLDAEGNTSCKTIIGVDQKIFETLLKILKGEETIKHHMQFLIKNNHTDMLILKQMKDAVRASTTHNAVVVANGIMHLGTTCDDFLRDNLEWISKAINWNKFNAVATLGLIHKGHEERAKKLLDPYLPKGETDQFGFKEGGSLYAYGLIHANHGNPEVTKFLTEELSKGKTSPVRHGASLALGLTNLASHDDKVYAALRDVTFSDEAVAGEAAATAMGLVMCGKIQNSYLKEMIQYVKDTEHDKIQRGLRNGIAIMAYGKGEEADSWINELLEDKSNAVFRQTGVCALAMAYAGTSKASIVRKLLSKVATDPNQDVKRYAVIAIGFVLCNDPEQCISYTAMLVEHFNGHVRYGAAMALGIACAGTGYKEAIALLEPLVQAKENYVRQGAMIALSFILVQQTEATCSKVTEYRKTLAKMTTEKTEDAITRFGAMISQGILDAGGRNVTISLKNKNGHPDMQSIVGTFVFLQHWYWHSYIHFSTLIFRPTCVIGLNKDLKMPATEFRCNAKVSTFAYPPATVEKKKEDLERVETAILSISNKKKGSRSGKFVVKIEPKVPEPEKMEVDKEVVPEKKEPEALTHNIQNPGRCVRLQLKTLSITENSRYTPVKSIVNGGIIMLKDRKPNEAEEIVALVEAGGSSGSADPANLPEEAKPHGTFEIDLSKY